MRSQGELPIPGPDCARVMTFWFEPLAAWGSLAAAHLVIADR